MIIKRAEKMGFCLGVKAAVELAEDLAMKKGTEHLYMLGMIVHNKRVINDLKNIGINFIDEKELLDGKIKLSKDDVVIVRAHGTIKRIYDIIDESKAKVYDAACTFVKRIRNLLIEMESKGYKIIFIGDENHPEVKGIISHGSDIKVYRDLKEVTDAKLDSNIKYCFLAQTTLNKNLYKEVKDYVETSLTGSVVMDTICGATFVRQKAIEELAVEAEAVIIVGGKNSSNTKKLYQIASTINENSFWVENASELDIDKLRKFNFIGITAGASTPEKSIVEIEKTLKEEL